MDWYVWMQSFKASNQRKTVLLLIWFPVLLFVIIWIATTVFYDGETYWSNRLEWWFYSALWIFFVVFLGLIIRWIISFCCQRKIMFELSGATPITRKDNPELYNIVENLCISKGLPMPKIAIMNESWMNAFATWWKPKDSWIAFTSGLVQNLNRNEIEAVAWHELTHIMNKDSLLMYVAVIFIGSISLIWRLIIRFRWSSSNNNWRSVWIIGLIGVGCLVLWYLFYPLIKLAISRKREYMADLGSVQLTMDNQAMISALNKISKNSYVEAANPQISAFFISDPNNINVVGNYASESTNKDKTSIWDSHPSISDRIQKLIGYGS